MGLKPLVEGTLVVLSSHDGRMLPDSSIISAPCIPATIYLQSEYFATSIAGKDIVKLVSTPHEALFGASDEVGSFDHDTMSNPEIRAA